MICAVLVLGLGQADAEAVKRSAEAVFAATPTPVVVPTGRPWVPEPSKDPRDRLFRLRRQPPPPLNEEVLRRIDALMKELQAKYGDDGLAMASDPKMKEVRRLSEQLQTPAQKAADAAMDRQNAEVEAYDRETLRWLNAQGYAKIPSYRGRMALILDRPVEGGGRARSWTTVEWTANNRFYSSRLGRMVWTGGYSVLAFAEVQGSTDPQTIRQNTVAPRRIDRPGRAFSQMHLGREGWYIKFPPIRSQDVWVHLPTLSTQVRNLNWMGTAQGSRDIGDGFKLPAVPGAPERWEVIQGYPLSGTSKAQRGAVQTVQPDGATVKIAWDFAPG